MRIVVCFRFTGTFDVDLFCFAKLSTVLTLRHWASFLFNFKKRAIAVFACRRPMTFNAGLAVEIDEYNGMDNKMNDPDHAYFLLLIICDMVRHW